MSYYASLKLGAPDRTPRRPWPAPRCSSGQSMRFVGQQSVQLHGGIGGPTNTSAATTSKKLTQLEMMFDTL